MSFVPVALAAEIAAAPVSPAAAVALSFGLNLKLFLAQLINFGLLVLVLWKLLYRPLVAFLNARTKRIAEGLQNATRYEEKLKALEAERQAVLVKAEAEARATLTAAGGQAEALKRQARAAAETEAQAIRERGEREAAQAKLEAMGEVRAAAADLVVMAAEKVLMKHIDATADRQFIERTLKEV